MNKKVRKEKRKQGREARKRVRKEERKKGRSAKHTTQPNHMEGETVYVCDIFHNQKQPDNLGLPPLIPSILSHFSKKCVVQYSTCSL